jgi:hypothetical protein
VTVATQLAKAHRALASARLLHRDGDTDGACNRAYRGCVWGVGAVTAVRSLDQGLGRGSDAVAKDEAR